MTCKTIGLAAIGLFTVTGPVLAQATRLVATEPGKFAIALCNVRPQGRINDGMRAVRTGIEDRDATRRAASLENAVTILTQAITTGSEGDAAAWYYLARAYLARGDVKGADSAFTRAEALLPACELDISQHRQNAWALLANAGIDMMRAGETDSALVLLLQANDLYRGLPHVMENIGVVYANQGQNDSAAAFFERAMTVSEGDSTLVENRNSATMNLAMMLQRSERHQEAIPVLQKYLAWHPDDMDTKRLLIYSYRQAGMVAQAEELEKAVAEAFSRMDFDSLSAQDLMTVGVGFFNASEYEKAADVFDRLVRRNPWNRDAVYNLANAYLALEQWDKLVEAGTSLVAIEPMNEDTWRLLGQGHRGLNQQAELAKAAENLLALPVRIEISGFGAGAAGARLTATATGRQAQDAGLQNLPAVPVTLVVEFLAADGRVLDTREVEIPALTVGATHPIQVDGQGEDIAGWRYRRK